MAWWNKKQKSETGLTSLRLMNGYMPVWTKTNSNAYENDIIRSVIHTIATHIGKLNPRCIRQVDGRILPGNSKLENKLRLNPNPLMSGYDYLYKCASQLLTHSNLIIYPILNNENELDFYPLNFSSVEFLENSTGELYCRYTFANGVNVTLPYNQVIHLRRYYNENELFGSDNTRVLYPTIQLINTSNDGIINAIKQSAHIRGILKTTGVLRETDIIAARDRFVEQYLSIENNGGIGALDSRFEFINTEIKPKVLDAEQMKLIEQKVYKFFNVNENIIMSKYTDNEWEAFYENIISPISVQLSIGHTMRSFTKTERGHGNEVIFETNKMQYASTNTKITLVQTLFDRGLITKNQALSIFNYPPIPTDDGNQTFMSLNYISTEIINQYQLGKTKKGVEEDGTSKGNSPNGS